MFVAIPFCWSRQYQGLAYILQLQLQTHTPIHTHAHYIQSRPKKSTTVENIIFIGTHVNTNSIHRNLSNTAQIHSSSPADTDWSSPAGKCIPFLFWSTGTCISPGPMNSRSDLNYIQDPCQDPGPHLLLFYYSYFRGFWSLILPCYLSFMAHVSTCLINCFSSLLFLFITQYTRKPYVHAF